MTKNKQPKCPERTRNLKTKNIKMNIQKEHQKLDAKCFRSLLAYVHVLTTRILFPNALTKSFAMCLSCCFLLSGFLKILGIHSFQQEVALFGDAYLGEWIRDFSFQLAVGVCVVEIFLGMFLLCRKLMLLVSTLAVFILLFFVYLTGRNFLYPTMMGSIESCGCFGELVHFSPLGAFIKSLVLFVVSLVNLFLVLKLRVKMLI